MKAALGFVAAFSLTACGATPAPVRAPAPTAPVASASAAPVATPAPTPSPPPAPPPPLAPVASPWHEIISSAYPELELAAFDGGALIAARTFVAVVTGGALVQDPRFVAGAPEWLNWDASDYLAIPDPRAPAKNGIPRNTLLSAHAGNRHGPDFDGVWTGNGWSTGPLPRDPRRAKLPRATQWVDEVTLSFASGDLLVVRFDASVQAFHVVPGAAKAVPSDLPLASSGYRHSLVGAQPNDVYLCEGGTGIYHYDGKAWAEVEADFTPESCAMTSDGTLWAVTVDHPGQPASVVTRRAGAWSEVPVPEGVNPTRIEASAKRAWLVGTSKQPERTRVFSTEPVTTSASVDEANLPGPLWVDGISGLDVVSIDVVSVSADPAGPGTSACTSLVLYVGPELTDPIRKALGTPPPRLVQVAGVKPGHIAPVAAGGANMTVQPSGQKRLGVAALPKSWDEGQALLAALKAAQPDSGARLVCATPRIVRDLK